jgi:hypothetical protein
MEDFLPGKLVYIDVLNKKYTNEDFCMYDTTAQGKVSIFYEHICLDSFPSFNDYSGKSYRADHGDPCIILKKIGRPDKITFISNWDLYDIYEVIHKDSNIFQIFKFNLSANSS